MSFSVQRELAKRKKKERYFRQKKITFGKIDLGYYFSPN